MKNLDKEKQELLSAIQDLGYESLRYSIFNEYGPGEWEVVIEYDDLNKCTMSTLPWIEQVIIKNWNLRILKLLKINF